MDQHLISLFDLKPNPVLITPFDEFKLYRDFDAFSSALNDYAARNELNEVEKFYLKVETDPRRRFFYGISQTFFDNYFLSIFFILSNPALINEQVFDNLYREKHLLSEIADHIIDLYKRLDSFSARFFNKILLDKFIANLDFQPLPDDVTGPEYKSFFALFTQEAGRLKSFLIEFVKDPKWSEHPEQGLSEFDPKYFQFAFEYNTGIKLNSPDDFIRVKTWAQKHLDYLMSEVNKTCDRLLTNDEDKKKTTYEKMMIVGKDKSQLWSSKQEMIDAHKAYIEKYRRIFIDQHKFKEFEAPGLIVLDNPLLAGGYYYRSKFYLNVAFWEEGNSKYEVENLVLHEVIPGHHLQLDISYHSPNNNLLTVINYVPCNGFVEGWALFAEFLGDDMYDDPWTYFGYLQSNILRTFRIIAEVLLHVEGKAPKQVVELGKQYLTTSEASIESEIYRYRVLPGQACSYKVGLEVFRRVIKEKFGVVDMKDFMRSDIQDWYKQILWATERPLDVFLREHQVTWTFDD